MQLILVTDIFGLTESVLGLAELARKRGITPMIVDPYNGQQQNLADERVAYRAFIEQCGHEVYAKLVQQALLNAAQPVHLVGFSSGASAAWNAVNGQHYTHLLQITAFYPSQIRHNLSAQPSAPVTLIFPSAEDHFNVDEVIAELSRPRPNNPINCIKTPYTHGFMNARCKSFSADGFARYLPWLLSDSGYTTTETLEQFTTGGNNETI